MPLENPVTPGIVDWTGENPGILLKDEYGQFSAMALFFRVAWSPAGIGQLLLLYGSPSSPHGSRNAPNIMIGDNEHLANFLYINFIGKLAAFRNACPYNTLTYTTALSITSSGDPRSHRYAETVVSSEHTIELIWEKLEEPLALELMPEQTGTGEHTMFTLLVPSRQAKIIVNGKCLPGNIGSRVQAGITTTTAFLYFAETWVLPENG